MTATPTLAVFLLLAAAVAAAAATECSSCNGDLTADAIAVPLSLIFEAPEAPAPDLPQASAINDTDIENPKSSMANAVPIFITFLLLSVCAIYSWSWRHKLEKPPMTADHADLYRVEFKHKVRPRAMVAMARSARGQHRQHLEKPPAESRPFIISRATKIDTSGNPSTDDYADLYRVEFKHEVHGDYSLTAIFSHAEKTAKSWIEEVRRSRRIRDKFLIAVCYYRGLQLEKDIPEPVQLLSLCAGNDSCFIAPLTPYGPHKKQRHSLPVAITSFLNSSEVQIVGMGLEQLCQRLFTQCGAVIPLGIELSKVVKVARVSDPKSLEVMIEGCKGWVFLHNPEKFSSGAWTGSSKSLDEITCAARDAFITFKVAAEMLGVARNAKEATTDDGEKSAPAGDEDIGKKGKGGASRGKKREGEGESSNSGGRHRV